MSASLEQQLDDILRRATELGPRDSLAYLKGACAGDAALYEAARLKLASHWPTGWEDEELDLTEGGMPPHVCGRAPGESIGPYRIIRALGAGGMGEVYLCERADNQFTQKVALKLVNPALTSRHIYNRLRTERQMLA